MRAFTTSISVVLVILYSVFLASAKTVTVVVGGNGTTQDPSLIFQPQEVQADVGDFVVFNFTNGTHSVVQSTFAEPCIPVHDTDVTVNGFNSGLRDTVNGSAITTLSVEITDVGPNNTVWFYDIWGCSEGGVGAINANDSSLENLDAFVRNAKRLNGTSSTSAGGSFTGGPTSTRSGPTSTATGNSAERVGANTVKAVSIFAPLLLVMFVA